MEKFNPFKWNFVITALLIFAFAFCCGCTGSSGTQDTLQTPPATTIPATTDAEPTMPPATTVPATPEVTAPPTIEMVPEENSPSVEVHDVERTDIIGLKYPTAGYTFLIVDFTVENSGDEAFQYHGGLVELVNDEGDSYPILADVTFCPGMEKNNPFYPILIESGKSERGKVVFGVPVDDAIVQFNLKDQNGDVIASAVVNDS